MFVERSGIMIVRSRSLIHHYASTWGLCVSIFCACSVNDDILKWTLEYVYHELKSYLYPLVPPVWSDAFEYVVSVFGIWSLQTFPVRHDLKRSLFCTKSFWCSIPTWSSREEKGERRVVLIFFFKTHVFWSTEFLLM